MLDYSNRKYFRSGVLRNGGRVEPRLVKDRKLVKCSHGFGLNDGEKLDERDDGVLFQERKLNFVRI